MNHRRGPGLGVFPVFLLVLGAFALGALMDRSGWLPGRVSRYQPRNLGKTFDIFWEAWNLVDRYYVDRQAVEPRRMTQGAIEGMLDSLGDTRHTTYLTPEELKQVESGLEGHFEGIGAVMTIRDHRPTVVQTLPDSPARAAGLKPGDVIVKIDGTEVTSLSLERIVQMVRGPADTTVHLTIERPGEASAIQFDIPRAKVNIADVTWHMLPGVPVAHIALHEFGEHTDEQLKSALQDARTKGAKGLILDVRANPGGLKEQAVAVTSEFLKEGNVFLEQDAQGNRTAVAVALGGIAPDIPVCVLIDQGTASAAEIFAGAMQDHERGKLVGARTFGTGTVLRPFVLSDGSAVLLAVAEWLTPKGRQIWHQGISPDVNVALSEGAVVLLPDQEGDLDAAALQKSEDKQLLKALEILRTEIP